MRLNFKLGLGAALSMMASSASAHYIHGTPEAPVHNLNHSLPLLGLGVVAAVLAFAAFRCFKSK